jgi:hypothetical protein
MPETFDPEKLARIGYEAFDLAAQHGGYHPSGLFANQDPVLMRAWVAAAEAIAAAGKVCAVCLWHLDQSNRGLQVEMKPDQIGNTQRYWVNGADRMRELLEDPAAVRRIQDSNMSTVGYWAETWWLGTPMCTSHASQYRLSGAPLPWAVIW